MDNTVEKLLKTTYNLIIDDILTTIMLTRKISKIRHHRSILTKTPQYLSHVVIEIFRQFPLNINLELKKAIILNAIEDALENLEAPNRLTIKDAHIAKHLPLAQKLEIALFFRKKYYASPVLTSHPTEILSEEARITINRIVKNVLLNTKKSKVQLKEDVCWIIEHSLLPNTYLTPQEEIDRQNSIYLDMMSSWSLFNRSNIAAFAKHHHQNKITITNVITSMNKYAYNHVASWAVADVDGNQKRNRQSMERMELSLQLVIVTRYMQSLQDLLEIYPSLSSSYAYLQRCQQAIQDGILFDLKGSNDAKERLCTKLQQLIQEPYLNPEHKNHLIELKDLIDLVGFRGELKQFVRQSSRSNRKVLIELGEILKKEHPQFQNLLQEKNYEQLTPENKAQFHDLLRTDSRYFKSIKNIQHQLSYHTLRELEILDFVTHYRDRFSYILSDTENVQSLDEVIILFALASYIHGHLFIDDIRKPPVPLIPLCETPKDLEYLPNILHQILQNPYLKEIIIERGELVYVAGPSDLGKEGGMFAHIPLIEAEKKAQDILKKHQHQDENLKDVELRVLYGLGGDFHRRVSQSAFQLFATFQGSEACWLGSYHAYASYVEQVTGQASENSFRALELRILELASPENNQYLHEIIQQCIHGYQSYTKHPAAENLFRELSIPYELGIQTNTSSRGESKSSEPQDILKSRAIGITNYDISTLLMTHVFMSADGLVELEIPHSSLMSIYEQTTVLQEIIQKILFSIAVSDEKRAWIHLLGYIPNNKDIEQMANQFKDKQSIKPEAALAYTVTRLPKIIQRLSKFIPYPEAIKDFWLQKNSNICSQLALELMQYIGRYDKHFANLAHEIKFDLQPRYQRLAACIDSYRQEYQEASQEKRKALTENCILALRGDKKITSGPRTIAKLHHRFDHLMNPSMTKRFQKN